MTGAAGGLFLHKHRITLQITALVPKDWTEVSGVGETMEKTARIDAGPPLRNPSDWKQTDTL